MWGKKVLCFHGMVISVQSEGTKSLMGLFEEIKSLRSLLNEYLMKVFKGEWCTHSYSWSHSGQEGLEHLTLPSPCSSVTC